MYLCFKRSVHTTWGRFHTVFLVYVCTDWHLPCKITVISGWCLEFQVWRTVDCFPCVRVRVCTCVCFPFVFHLLFFFVLAFSHILTVSICFQCMCECGFGMARRSLPGEHGGHPEVWWAVSARWEGASAWPLPLLWRAQLSLVQALGLASWVFTLGCCLWCPAPGFSVSGWLSVM